ncbi:MAG TPA: PEP/pyruvate-binding domain-containing protein, partial [Arachnia sp.]|nr:PEP/pyruvate-binding domain-containing protein [Arachnia sp.]
MVRLCRPLADLTRDDLALVGGKAANLGELIGAGFDVPPGFVVTTDAYRLAVSSLQPTMAAIAAAPMPDPADAAIREAYRSLGEGPVAVRSSATAEDLPGATFAGQQDTFLNVIGADAVVAAVRGCWA